MNSAKFSTYPSYIVFPFHPPTTEVTGMVFILEKNITVTCEKSVCVCVCVCPYACYLTSPDANDSEYRQEDVDPNVLNGLSVNLTGGYICKSYVIDDAGSESR